MTILTIQTRRHTQVSRSRTYQPLSLADPDHWSYYADIHLNLMRPKAMDNLGIPTMVLQHGRVSTVPLLFYLNSIVLMVLCQL